MRSSIHRLVRVLLKIASLFFVIECYEVRSVNTAWELVRGERVHPNGGDLPPVTQFLGVPYGVAPSGQFRFNMAISSAKWTHLPKEARKLAPACFQMQLPELSETRAFKQMSAQRFDYVHRLLPKLKLQSEDCLYMNIFVPERLDKRRHPLTTNVLMAFVAVCSVVLKYILSRLEELERMRCFGNDVFRKCLHVFSSVDGKEFADAKTISEID